MTEGPVRFGVLGAGRIARNAFAPAIAQSEVATLWAATSRDSSRAAELGASRTYDDAASLLADTDVEAVYVPAHNGLHRDHTVAALRAGKHVLCEKPLGRDAEECSEMVDVARETGLHLVEAFMYRHHPQIAAAQAAVAGGQIGALKTVEASFSFHLTREDDVRLRPEWGGGALLDVGCYCVNACRVFLGDQPRTIHAAGHVDEASGVDVSLHGILDYGGGQFGVVSCGFDSGLRNRVLLSGTKGTLELPNAFVGWRDPTEMVIRTEAATERTAFEPVDLFQREIDDLARAIRSGGTPHLAPDEGLRNARILDAMLAQVHAARA